MATALPIGLETALRARKLIPFVGAGVSRAVTTPDGHPLFSAPRCLVTPHVANHDAVGIAALAAFVAENARRFLAGDPLRSPIDPARGY